MPYCCFTAAAAAASAVDIGQSSSQLRIDEEGGEKVKRVIVSLFPSLLLLSTRSSGKWTDGIHERNGSLTHQISGMRRKEKSEGLTAGREIVLR